MPVISLGVSRLTRPKRGTPELCAGLGYSPKKWIASVLLFFELADLLIESRLVVGAVSDNCYVY